VRKMYESWFSGPWTHVFLTPEAVDHLLPSSGRLLAGWGLAGAVGIVLGVALGRSPAVMPYVEPLISFARSVPAAALFPVFLVLFKVGTPMQLATITFGAIWPVLLNTIDGARSVDQTQLDTARAFRIPRPQWLFGVVLPAAAPKIFAGLRISLSLCLVLMVLSELVGATDGIGYLTVVVARSEYDLAKSWAGIVLLGILGNVLNWLLLAGQRRLLAWHTQAKGIA